MPNLFAKANDWLPVAVEAAAGDTVTYTRGAEQTETTATVGQTVFASNLEGGARIEFGDRDYLIQAANLPYGDPQEGDRITQTVNGTAMTFEVTTPGTGDPAWRWSGPARMVARLHTKRVA